MTNNLKTLAFSAAMLVACGSAYADGGSTITIHTATNQNTYAISDVNQLTFADKSFSVVMKNTSETPAFNFADVKKITFKVATGINNNTLNESAGKLSYTLNNNLMTITGANTGNANNVSFYTVSGVRCMQLNSWRGEQINISSLPAGVYIVKVNNQTIKFKK